jgi:hypothetical protein
MFVWGQLQTIRSGVSVADFWHRAYHFRREANTTPTDPGEFFIGLYIEPKKE